MLDGVIVGVDAGGSRTVAAAARGDDVLLVSTGDPANARTLGVEGAADAIARAVRDAIGDAPPAAIFAGVAGAWRDDVSTGLCEALIAEFPGVAVGVSSDVHIALRAGAPQGDALLLLSGTGSIAYAEAGGARFRAGGYGAVLGDEGSGYAIGNAALRLLVRVFDGRAFRDAFTDALAEHAGATCADDLVELVREPHHRAAIARFAPMVLESANAGERSATKIVQAAALDLFELLRALVKSAGAAGRELPLVFAGGLLVSNSMLTYLLETRIANEFPHLHVRKDVAEPYVGALAAARRLVR